MKPNRSRGYRIQVNAQWQTRFCERFFENTGAYTQYVRIFRRIFHKILAANGRSPNRAEQLPIKFNLSIVYLSYLK